MTNKLLLYIVLALALTFSVSAVGSINIADTIVYMSGNPGAINSTEYFTVHNIGVSDLTGIVVNASGLTGAGGTIPSSALALVPDTMGLTAGANAPSAIVLTIPAAQKAGTYLGNAYAVYDPSNQDSVVLSVTVNAVPAFTGSGTTPSIVQGTSGYMTVDVTNTGNSDIVGMMYRVSEPFVSGANTLDVASSTVGTTSISYGSSNSFTVTFSPSGSQPTGLYTGHVNLSYGGVETTVPLTVSVEAINRQMSGSSTSAAVVMNRASSLVHSTSAGNMTLTNTGNYPLTGVTIYASDLTGPGTISASNILVSSNGFSMSVGETKSVFLTPSGLSPALASGTYSGTLLVDFGGTSNMSVPFSVVISDAVASITPNEIVYPLSLREENVSTSVTITNTGDFALTGITLTTSVPNTWITGTVPASLAVGGSFVVTVTSTVPESVDSGLDKIGTINFNSAQYSKSIDLKTNVESMLVFDYVKVSIDDNSWDSVNDGGSADDEATPGDTFAVKVKLENLFDDDSNIDMQDVEITALFSNAGEDGDDIEGDSESFDIDAGDKSGEIEIDFDDDTIDWEADSGNLLMEIWAEGDDDDGNRHTAYFSFTIEVKRETNADFIFTRIDAPSTVNCGNTFVLYIDGRSVGEDSDDEVELRIENSALGINIKEEFEMGAFDDDTDCDATDGDNECSVFEYRKTISIPSNIGEGSYTLDIELFRDGGNKKTDEDTLDLNVDCGSSSSSSSSSSTTSGSTSTGATITGTSGSSSTTGTSGSSSKPSTTTGTSNPSSTTSSVDVFYGGGSTVSPSRGVVASMPTKITDTTKNDSFGSSQAYLALLSILSVLVIIGIVVLLIYAFTRPAE